MTYYNIEVQMLGENERCYDLDEEIGWELGFAEDDIDERELYRLTALFTSETNPGKMKLDAIGILQSHPEIFYIDVMFRNEHENVPDRFVVWQDGRIRDYKGKIYFEEVN